MMRSHTWNDTFLNTQLVIDKVNTQSIRLNSLWDPDATTAFGNSAFEYVLMSAFYSSVEVVSARLSIRCHPILANIEPCECILYTDFTNPSGTNKVSRDAIKGLPSSQWKSLGLGAGAGASVVFRKKYNMATFFGGKASSEDACRITNPTRTTGNPPVPVYLRLGCCAINPAQLASCLFSVRVEFVARWSRPRLMVGTTVGDTVADVTDPDIDILKLDDVFCPP